MKKAAALDKITKEILVCKICKTGTNGKAVPGEGSPDADIAFIGEAPGKTEALTGRPFVGRSGKFLRSLIRTLGLEEEDVYITSPVKYLPDRGTPTNTQIAHGKTHLDKQLEIINPKLIVLMGSVAAQGVLGEKIPVLKQHGKTIKKEGKTYFLTVHPAAAIRFEKFRKIMLEDFAGLKKIIDKISR